MSILQRRVADSPGKSYGNQRQKASKDGQPSQYKGFAQVTALLWILLGLFRWNAL